MKTFYKTSLQMIKRLNIQSEEEYNRLLKDYLILSSESLKYILQTRNFDNIVRVAREE